MTYQINHKAAGFRPLVISEIQLVSGGDGEIVVTGSRPRESNSFTQDGGGGSFGASPAFVSFGDGGRGGFDFGSWFESLLGGEPVVTVSLEPEDIDGDGEPGITVTPPPIQEIGANGEVRYFRLLSDGSYVEYERVFGESLFDWRASVDFVPFDSGTYTATYNPGTTSISVPAGVSFTFPSVSYTFDSNEP